LVVQVFVHEPLRTKADTVATQFELQL